MIKAFLNTILILLLIVAPVWGQASRPKIGLVLSGGGAKGLAHIGVLKVLEEHGIYPDYITGTSMGSIIGGLYASGYTAHELDSIVNNLNWEHLLSDEIPLSSVSPQEKEDYNRYQAEFNITKKRLEIPSGLIKGQQISEMLASLTWHVSDAENFDQLPIPFRCVAADLKSGMPYIFKDGDLSSAMRASMSIPTVFSPVRKDSMLLVDGGILNNYPVRLCKEMGADIIIGVNVGIKYETGEDNLQTFADILMAAATIGGNNSMRRALIETDFLIWPGLSPFNAGSFSDASKIILIGEDAARKKTKQLRAFMDSLNIRPTEIGPFDKSQMQEVVISQIQINSTQNVNNSFLLGNLGIQPGDTITPLIVANGMKKAMGTRHFENITYHIESLNSHHNLILNVEGSPQAKAKFSLHYDNEYKAGLMANLSLRNFLGKASRTSFTTDISETPKFSLSQVNYLGKQQITAATIAIDYENNNLPVYLDNGSKYGTFKQEYTELRGGFMTAIGTNWMMDAYLQHTTSTLQNKSGFADIFYAGVERFGNSFLSTHFDFIFNSMDSRYFPRKGTNLALKYGLKIDIQELYKGSTEGEEMVGPLTHIPNKNYFTLSSDYTRYFPVNNHLTTGVRLSGKFTSQSSPFLDLTFIGGLPFNNRSNEVHFIGYSFREKLVENFGLGEFNFRYRLLNKVHVNTTGSVLYSTTNLPEVVEPIGLDKTEWVFGYGATVAYDSFLGPVQIGLGSNDTDNRMRWYFNFGFNF